MPFDIEGARKAGYSDGEIASYLAAENKFDVNGARKAGYNDTEIITHLTQPKESTSMDVVKSIGSAIPKAAAGLIGLPQTLVDLGDRGLKWLGEKTGPHPLLDKLDRAVGFNPDDKRLMREQLGIPHLGELSLSGYKQMGLVHEPQTKAGRYLGAGTEGALMMGTNPTNAVTGLSSGLLGELGYDIGGTPGRVIGSLIPSIFTLGRSIRSGPAEIIRERTKHMTPQDWEAKIRQRNDSLAIKSPATAPEILNDSELLKAQLIAEQSRQGSKVMTPFMQARPEQAKAAVNKELQNIGPAVDPRTVGPRVSEAADTAINEARRAGNRAAAPYYGVVDPANKVSAEALKDFRKDRAVTAAINSTRRDPYSGIPKNTSRASMTVLDKTQKRLGDKIENARDEKQFELAKDLTEARNKILSAADEAFPDYATARSIVAKNMKENVVPMQEGLVGKLAELKNAPEQAKALLDRELSRPAQIREVAKNLRTQDPNALRDLMRLHIENQLDKALAKSVSGTSEAAGAKFSVLLRQTPQAEQNLLTALKELPGGKDNVLGFKKMLDVFEAQGRRLSVGSRTAFNQEIQREMSGGTVIGKATATATSPTEMLGAMRHWYDKFRYSKNTAEFARIITAPDNLEKMRELSQLSPTSNRAAAIVNSMIAVSRDENQ